MLTVKSRQYMYITLTYVTLNIWRYIYIFKKFYAYKNMHIWEIYFSEFILEISRENERLILPSSFTSNMYMTE